MMQMFQLKRITSESDRHLCCSFLDSRLSLGREKHRGHCLKNAPEMCNKGRKRLAMSHDISGRMTPAEYSSRWLNWEERCGSSTAMQRARTAAPHRKDIYSLI